MSAARPGYPAGTIGELIVAHATARPDVVAVRQWDTELTYAELVAAASRLAGRLRELGVGPETRVGVCVGRHPGLPVALVGVLLSGGAYVPLDPDLPAPRLTGTARAAAVACVVADKVGREVLADAELSIVDLLDIAGEVLTYRDLRRCAEAVASKILAIHGAAPDRVALLASRSLVAFAGYLAALRLGATVVPLNPTHPLYRNELICRSIPLDVLITDGPAADLAGTAIPLTHADVLGAQPGPLPGLSARPDDVAYVLFTSGSTGRPKGVPISHANVSPYVARNIARFEVGPGCRVSHTFDLTFDPSVFDLFVTWGGGATLVCPNRTDLLTPVDFLVDKAITHWSSVPSVVSVSANLGNLHTCGQTALRQSIFIGEQLTYRQAAVWRAVAPTARIDNVYGPTELTVACTEYRLPEDSRQWPTTSNNTVPIGPVYDHLDHVIVDGIPATEGELCVRGVQRFTGYLDPQDNQGRFLLRDGDRYLPCDAVTPESYYRTGDRVRWENGHLVHLSRLDHQLKIWGYRVELGEVEAAIALHPEVTQAVVVAVPHDEGPELVGFYTGTPMSDRQLIGWLRDYLPIHMVPRHLLHLDALPLNVNGKLDRNALRAREGPGRDAM